MNWLNVILFYIWKCKNNHVNRMHVLFWQFQSKSILKNENFNASEAKVLLVYFSINRIILWKKCSWSKMHLHFTSKNRKFHWFATTNRWFKQYINAGFSFFSDRSHFVEMHFQNHQLEVKWILNIYQFHIGV